VTEARRVADQDLARYNEDRAAWTQVLRELLNRIQAPDRLPPDPQHQPRLPMTDEREWELDQAIGINPPRDGHSRSASALRVARGPREGRSRPAVVVARTWTAP